MTVQEREQELAANLAEVRGRIADACGRTGRDVRGITLVAVTKTFPASDLRLLAGIGVTDVGENREQEASAKHSELAELVLRWHFVGALQRNKCRAVASYADVVHSVDRPALVSALGAAAVAAGRTVTALIQVSLESSADPSRSGAPAQDVARLADLVAVQPGLRLGGVMAVAPLGRDPDPAFAVLQELSVGIAADHPAATMISAGMSGDLEAAIRHGATHPRVGTALLGSRSGLVR